MSNFLRGETCKQRQELVYPYSELGRFAFLSLLPSPVKAASGSVCLNTECGYGSPSAAPEAEPGSSFSETPPSLSSAPALEEVGEDADKGKCCPQSAAGETSTRQKGEQAPVCDLSPWLEALLELGTCLHTRAPSHGNAPAPAQAVPQKLGYTITQALDSFTKG